MPLKNYTSQVPASTSVQRIISMLTTHGAFEIMMRYNENRRIEAIIYTIVFDDQPLSFKLPARIAECEQVLRKSTTTRTRSETIKKLNAQAERTAWKILVDWVEVQMAMIDLAQVEMAEVFLPYLYDFRIESTFYEQLKSQGTLRLLQENLATPTS